MAELEFRLPDIGEGLAEAEVVQWLVEVGDSVQENQIVAQIETDKAVVDLPAPATGVVKRLPVGQGERVKVGSVLLVLSLPDSAASPQPAPPGPAAKTPANRDAQAAAGIQAAPAARKLAAELEIDLAEVRGTGPEGRISADDVSSYAKSSPSPPTGKTGVDSERILVKGVRRRIAEALTQTARTVPHVCGFHEIDAWALREAFERGKLAVSHDIRLTYLPFLIKAVALALRDHPYLNASYDEAGPAIVLHKRRNIGIAVATTEGLVVPVVREADLLDVLAIAQQVARLTAAAHDRSLQPAELQHSTFTISNVGGVGGWFGTSILHYPEAALLGVGRIEERVVVREGRIVIRPILPVSLTFDHRVLDGDAALAFIQQLRHLLGYTDSPALAAV